MFGVFQGEPTATLPPPTSIKDVVLLNCTYPYIHVVLLPWRVITVHCMKLQPANTSYFFTFWISIWQCVPDLFCHNLCVIPVPYGVIYGCGDLIFSSHMTFALTFCHTYNKYGTKRYVTSVSIDYQRGAWQLVCYESSFSLLKLVDTHLLSICLLCADGLRRFLGSWWLHSASSLLLLENIILWTLLSPGLLPSSPEFLVLKA